ncbi:hypothetical protein IAT38_003269 [Cryptococcus sp. DSM 104549]
MVNSFTLRQGEKQRNDTYNDSSSTIDQDAADLAKMGYKASLARRWGLTESFAASFCAMDFIAGSRSYIFLGIEAGGPAAVW